MVNKLTYQTGEPDIFVGGGIACFIALPAALWNKGGWIQNRATRFLFLWAAGRPRD